MKKHKQDCQKNDFDLHCKTSRSGVNEMTKLLVNEVFSTITRLGHSFDEAKIMC